MRKATHDINLREEKLKELDSQLKLFVEHSPAALAMFDTDMRYIIASRRWIADYGLSEDNLTGKSHYEIFPDIPQRWKDIHQRCLTGQSEKNDEDKFVREDGRIDWVRWEIQPWHKASGKVGGIIMFTEVITQRKAEQAEKEFAHYLLNERVKELTTLNRSSAILQTGKKSVTEVLGEIVSILPEGWQYPEITEARIAWGEMEFSTPRFASGSQKLSASFQTSDGTKGVVEIVYIEKKQEETEGAFFLEERNLINMIAEMLRNYLDRNVAMTNLMKSEANLQTILDTTNVAYTLLDKNLNVISCNQESRNFVANELHSEAMLGVHISEYLVGSKHKQLHELIPEVYDGKTVEYETDYPQPDGLPHWYHIRIIPILNNQKEFIGIMLTFSNITEQKQMELQREKMTTDLIQRNKNLEQFSYIVSHNLRAPIANILGLSAALEANNIGEDFKMEIQKSIFDSVKKLDEVIIDLNNVLHVKRDLSDKREWVTFSRMANNIHASIESQIEKEEAVILWDFSEVDQMLTIKSYLHSIFYNLISNSIKYRQPEISPVIEIKSRKLNDKIILSFKDNGMGIDLKRKGDQVFGLYKRFHLEVEGKGMGLFMVKTQVETIGGKISINSEVNKGTEFIIEFENNG